MKILFLSWGILPQKTGGLEKATYYYFKYLQQDNIVFLIIPNFSDDVALFWKNKLKNGKIYGLNISYKFPYVNYNGRSILSYRKNLIDYKSAVMEYKEKVLELIKKLNIEFDIIYCYDWLTIPAAIELKKVYNKPLVIHFHSTAYDRVGGSLESLKYLVDLDYGIEIEGCRNADKIITVSNRVKDILIKYYNCNGDKIEVIYNAPDDDFSIKEKIKTFINSKYKIVLYLGRLTLHKGPDYLLKAAKKVLEKRKDVLFVFAGTGEMMEDLIKLSASLGISKNVIFTGFVSEEQAEFLYSISDIFVLPSVSEPFGLTPFEALKYQNYLIISKQTGVGEVLKHALKVDFWDINKMADYILALIEYPKIGKIEVELCLEDIKTLSWRESVSKLLSIFHNIYRVINTSKDVHI